MTTNIDTSIESRLVPKTAEQFVNHIHDIYKKKFTYKLYGSYIRGKERPGDIDMLVKSSPIIIETLKNETNLWKPYSKGDRKISGYFKYGRDKITSIDIWFYNPDEKATMVLFLTGSPRFNIIMRKKAKNKGMTLGQYQLRKGDKVIKVKNEREIFKILDMTYRTPIERNI